MRGRGKDVTANIAIGIGTAAEAAAGRNIGSIGGEIETRRANGPHVATAGLTGAGAAVGMRIIAGGRGTTGPRGAEAAAGSIGGQRETDTVKGLQTGGGASALNGGGVIDKCYKTWGPGPGVERYFG